MSLLLPKTILWDMDGTLIDQSRPIIRCYAEVITSMGYPRPAPQTIQRSMGGPMRSTMDLFVEDDRMDEACNAFRALFPKIMFDGLTILPGALELIKFFAEQKIPQAILTNKHGDTARMVSEHCEFSNHIRICIGNSDTEWAKPEAELTNYVLKQIGATSDGAVLIGDSPTDVKTALNAGIDCYGVETGAHTAEELNKAGANASFGSLSELMAQFD